MRDAFFKLHLSILLAGCTGLFGKLIQLNETEIVAFRMLLASIIMLCIFRFPRKVTKRQFARAALAGGVLALHWMLFYSSIKVSNVCIGVLCFSLTGVWTAIIEPLYRRRRPQLSELALSLLTVAGIASIYLFAPDAQDAVGGVDVKKGVLIGALSSLVCSIYVIMSKEMSQGMRSRDFLQCSMSGGLILALCFIPVYLWAFGLPVTEALHTPQHMDWVWMLCHASFCTVGMYLLQLEALRKLSAFTVNLSYNLEPVYSIIFAIAFMGEAQQLTGSFFVGLALIILSVVLQSVQAIKKQKH